MDGRTDGPMDKTFQSLIELPVVSTNSDLFGGFQSSELIFLLDFLEKHLAGIKSHFILAGVQILRHHSTKEISQGLCIKGEKYKIKIVQEITGRRIKMGEKVG